jgi:hypothetical protein
MKKSEIISSILIESGAAKDAAEAKRLFVQAFVDNYISWNLQRWDTEVPHADAQSYIDNVGSANGMSVKFLIKDLDHTLQKGKH